MCVANYAKVLRNDGYIETSKELLFSRLINFTSNTLNIRYVVGYFSYTVKDYFYIKLIYAIHFCINRNFDNFSGNLESHCMWYKFNEVVNIKRL